MKRVRNTLVACALAATLLCAPSPSPVSARLAPTPGTARQLPQQSPPPQQTPSPPQQQDQRPARRADETQPPLLPPAPPAPRPTPAAATAATPEQRPVGVGDDDVLNVDTSLVNVVFNATDADRRFVTTLKREDVRVFEDGVPQEVTIFQRETELPLSIAILVDVSVSQKDTLPVEKDAARAFINQILRPGKDTAAVISFTGSATLEQDMTQDRASLHFAIDSLRVILPPGEEDEDAGAMPAAGGSNAGGAGAGGVAAADKTPAAAGAVPPAASAPPPVISDEDADIGHTSIWDAVWAASNEVLAQTPPHTRRAVILLSDGDDTKSRINREAAAEAAVKTNTIVYSIGIEPVGYKLDKKALRKISEATGGRAFFPEDETQLNAAFHQIQQELRTQYLAAYTPTNKARDGSFRRLRIEFTTPDLKKQKLKLAYREGYFALAPPAAAAARRERAPQDRLARPPRRPRK